nr:FtsW/RodA/SpoVE family cell cycle protein [Bacillus pakistanensis]
MGSPLKLGQHFNKIHRPQIDWWLTILLVITLGFGFLPMFSSNLDTGHFALYKVIITLIGISITLWLMLFDYTKLKKYKWLLYNFGLFILFMLLFGPTDFTNGLPTIRVGPLTIEGTMALPFFYISWAAFFRSEKASFWKLGILFVVPLYLFLLIPSLSTTFIYIMMVFIMIWWSTLHRMKTIIIVLLTTLPISIYLFLGWIYAREYQKERLLAFLNPEEYAYTGGYLYLRIEELLSGAGWFGHFTNKEFIPSAHTDFVFVSFTYQYGWLFAIVLVAILSMLMFRMLLVIRKVKDPFGKMLVLGGITLFTVQFVYNIGMILGFLPLTDISLPFISYGLMPTLLNSIIIGTVLSVYRRKDLIITTKLQC